jgi:exosortase/archaeosortase family protein
MSADRAALAAATARRGGSLVDALLVIAACVVAFHYSLASLAASLAKDTPLANLALVPVTALLLAAVRARPRPQEPTIHDRELDWILGIPLLLMAVTMSVLVRDHWSSLYWTWRLDLLTLPIFVAGLVTIVLGTRMVWRIRVAMLVLFAVWPVPTDLLLRSLGDKLTHATTLVISAALRVLPIASAAHGKAWLLSVGAGAERFDVAITQACSGAYGLVGFAVVGGAVAVSTRGSWVRKMGWLSVGLALTWLFNTVRILLLLASGNQWGEQAIADLHPLFGVASFVVAVLVMLALLPVVGLQLPTRGGDARSALLPQAMRRSTVIVVGIAALVFAVLNADLRRFAPLSEPLGAPLMLSFEGAGTPVTPAGWVVTNTDKTSALTTTNGYFGDASTWFRYQYTAKSAPADTAPILVDVVTTTAPRTLETQGVAQSYGFRSDQVTRKEPINLRAGVSATATAFHTKDRDKAVTTLHWVWPVQTASGRMYERIALMSTPSRDDSQGRFARDVEGLRNLADALIAAQARMSAAPRPQPILQEGAL